MIPTHIGTSKTLIPCHVVSPPDTCNSPLHTIPSFVHLDLKFWERGHPTCIYVHPEFQNHPPTPSFIPPDPDLPAPKISKPSADPLFIPPPNQPSIHIGRWVRLTIYRWVPRVRYMASIQHFKWPGR